MLRRISIADIYTIMEPLKELPPGVKVGLIIAFKQKWIQEITERLAANRGIYLKVCIDHEAAEIWLLDSSDTIKER